MAVGYAFMRFALGKEFDFQYSQRDIAFFMILGAVAAYKFLSGIYHLLK